MLDIFKAGLILALVRGIFRQQNDFIYEWRVKMADLSTQLDEIAGKLDEASTEIPQLIQELKDAIGTVSPEAQAKLDAISNKVRALADIVPDEAPEPTPSDDPVVDPEDEVPTTP